MCLPGEGVMACKSFTVSWTEITVPASFTSVWDAALSAESAEGVFLGAQSGFIEFVWWVPPPYLAANLGGSRSSGYSS